MILPFFRSYFPRLPPKTITYRNFRYFETKDFLYELENKLRTNECNGGVKYEDLTSFDLTSHHVNDKLSDFVSAYRSKYSSNHRILRLIKEWKGKLTIY